MEKRKIKKNQDHRVAGKIASGTALKQYFEGNWSFKRMIFCSSCEEPFAEADGHACFSAVGKEKLVYKEEGKLSLRSSGQTFPFSRSFIYLFGADQLEVYFNDGSNSDRLYQRYLLDSGNNMLSPGALHICRDDCYNGIYSLLSPVEYKLATSIKGPKKEFRIETYAKRTKDFLHVHQPGDPA